MQIDLGGLKTWAEINIDWLGQTSKSGKKIIQNSCCEKEKSKKWELLKKARRDGEIKLAMVSKSRKIMSNWKEFGRVIGLGLDGEKQLSLGLANTQSLPSLAST